MATHARESAHAGLVAHALHHLRRLLEALQQRIDRGDGDARTIRDARTARTVDDLRVAAFFRRHRADDRLGAVDLALVELLEFLAVLRHARTFAKKQGTPQLPEGLQDAFGGEIPPNLGGGLSGLLG